MRVIDIIPRNLYLCNEFDEFALHTKDIDFAVEDLVSQVISQSDIYYWLNIESIWGRMGFIWDNKKEGQGHFASRSIPFHVIPKIPDGERIYTFYYIFNNILSNLDKLTVLDSNWKNLGLDDRDHYLLHTYALNSCETHIYLGNIDFNHNNFLFFAQSKYLYIEDLDDNKREKLKDKTICLKYNNNNSYLIYDNNKYILKLPCYIISLYGSRGAYNTYIKYTGENIPVNTDDISTLDKWGLYGKNYMGNEDQERYTQRLVIQDGNNDTGNFIVKLKPYLGDIDRPLCHLVGANNYSANVTYDFSIFNMICPNMDGIKSIGYPNYGLYSNRRKFINGFPKYLTYGFNYVCITNENNVTYKNINNEDILLTEEEFNQYWDAYVDIGDDYNYNYRSPMAYQRKENETDNDYYLRCAKYSRTSFFSRLYISPGKNKVFIFPHIFNYNNRKCLDIGLNSYIDESDLEKSIIFKISNGNNITSIINDINNSSKFITAYHFEEKTTINLKKLIRVQEVLNFIDNSYKIVVNKECFENANDNRTIYINCIYRDSIYEFDYSDYVLEVDLNDLLSNSHNTAIIFNYIKTKDGIYNNNLIKFYNDRDELFNTINLLDNSETKYKINTIGKTQYLTETYAPAILLNNSFYSMYEPFNIIVHDWCFIKDSIYFNYDDDKYFDFEGFVNAVKETETKYTFNMNETFYNRFTAEQIQILISKGYTIIKYIN